jgi:hypothetical protein
MILLILTVRIGEEYEIQGRSLGWLLNRGGCDRPGPFFSHFHSLKSQSVPGQVPAGGRETREAGSRGHPFRRIRAYLHDHLRAVYVCRRLQTASLPPANGPGKHRHAGQDTQWNGCSGRAIRVGIETRVNDVAYRDASAGIPDRTALLPADDSALCQAQLSRFGDGGYPASAMASGP